VKNDVNKIFASDGPHVALSQHLHHCWLYVGDTFMIPSFAGQSYLQLRRLEHGFREIWVEMTFRSMQQSGVLLYTGQSSDGVGDFMALVINDNYIEFRSSCCSRY